MTCFSRSSRENRRSSAQSVLGMALEVPESMSPLAAAPSSPSSRSHVSFSPSVTFPSQVAFSVSTAKASGARPTDIQDDRSYSVEREPTADVLQQEGLDLAQRLPALLPDLRKRAIGLTRDGARADDLVQDTIERALRFRDSFREGSHLRAWLMRIMQNIFISGRRRAAIERRVLEGARVDPNVWTKQEPTRLVPGLSRPMERALSDLPLRLREVIDLVDLEEYSYRDAAVVQEVPIGTVMSRLHRGRSRLKLMLSGEDAMHAA